jgi:hypothetical protein
MNVAVVVAAFPFDSVFSGDQFVHLAHTSAFNAAVDRTARRRLLPKASAIHFAHNVETSLIVERDTGLIEQGTLRGWSNYFRYGTRRSAFRSVDRYTYERVRWWPSIGEPT